MCDLQEKEETGEEGGGRSAAKLVLILRRLNQLVSVLVKTKSLFN